MELAVGKLLEVYLCVTFIKYIFKLDFEEKTQWLMNIYLWL